MPPVPAPGDLPILGPQLEREILEAVRAIPRPSRAGQATQQAAQQAVRDYVRELYRYAQDVAERTYAASGSVFRAGEARARSAQESPLVFSVFEDLVSARPSGAYTDVVSQIAQRASAALGKLPISGGYRPTEPAAYPPHIGLSDAVSLGILKPVPPIPEQSRIRLPETVPILHGTAMEVLDTIASSSKTLPAGVAHRVVGALERHYLGDVREEVPVHRRAAQLRDWLLGGAEVAGMLYSLLRRPKEARVIVNAALQDIATGLPSGGQAQWVVNAPRRTMLENIATERARLAGLPVTEPEGPGVEQQLYRAAQLSNLLDQVTEDVKNSFPDWQRRYTDAFNFAKQQLSQNMPTIEQGVQSIQELVAKGYYPVLSGMRILGGEALEGAPDVPAPIGGGVKFLAPRLISEKPKPLVHAAGLGTMLGKLAQEAITRVPAPAVVHVAPNPFARSYDPRNEILVPLSSVSGQALGDAVDPAYLVAATHAGHAKTWNVDALAESDMQQMMELPKYRADIVGQAYAVNEDGQWMAHARELVNSLPSMGTSTHYAPPPNYLSIPIYGGHTNRPHIAPVSKKAILTGDWLLRASDAFSGMKLASSVLRRLGGRSVVLPSGAVIPSDAGDKQIAEALEFARRYALDEKNPLALLRGTVQRAACPGGKDYCTATLKGRTVWLTKRAEIAALGRAEHEHVMGTLLGDTVYFLQEAAETPFARHAMAGLLAGLREDRKLGVSPSQGVLNAVAAELRTLGRDDLLPDFRATAGAIARARGRMPEALQSYYAELAAGRSPNEELRRRAVEEILGASDRPFLAEALDEKAYASTVAMGLLSDQGRRSLLEYAADVQQKYPDIPIVDAMRAYADLLGTVMQYAKLDPTYVSWRQVPWLNTALGVAAISPPVGIDRAILSRMPDSTLHAIFGGAAMLFSRQAGADYSRFLLDTYPRLRNYLRERGEPRSIESSHAPFFHALPDAVLETRLVDTGLIEPWVGRKLFGALPTVFEPQPEKIQVATRMAHTLFSSAMLVPIRNVDAPTVPVVPGQVPLRFGAATRQGELGETELMESLLFGPVESRLSVGVEAEESGALRMGLSLRDILTARKRLRAQIRNYLKEEKKVYTPRFQAAELERRERRELLRE